LQALLESRDPEEREVGFLDRRKSLPRRVGVKKEGKKREEGDGF